jgi:hypothetical protein
LITTAPAATTGVVAGRSPRRSRPLPIHHVLADREPPRTRRLRVRIRDVEPVDAVLLPPPRGS